jgi:hypothetical protein
VTPTDRFNITIAAMTLGFLILSALIGLVARTARRSGIEATELQETRSDVKAANVETRDGLNIIRREIQDNHKETRDSIKDINVWMMQHTRDHWSIGDPANGRHRSLCYI